MEPISKLISTAREAIGWNQSELARAVGVTPQAVQKWEAGAAVPRMRKMVEIAQALSIEHEKIVQAYGLLSAEARLTAKISGRAREREGDQLPAGLSSEEKRLLRLFRSIPSKFQETALAQIKALADLTTEKVNPAPAEKSGTIEHPTQVGATRLSTAKTQGVTKTDEKLLDFDEAVAAVHRLAGVEGASPSANKKGKQGNKA